MIDLQNYFIAERLPDNLRDENFIDLANLSDDFLHKVDDLISKVLIYPNVDNLDEDLINHLGFQQHIERFSTSLPLESKRELVKNSFLIHRYKGTPWAVETAISLMLAPTEVSEWFDYDGEPYFFRPIIDMTDARIAFDEERKIELIKIINATKNVRSWLDYIILLLRFHEDEGKNLADRLSTITVKPLARAVYPWGQGYYGDGFRYGGSPSFYGQNYYGDGYYGEGKSYYGAQKPDRLKIQIAIDGFRDKLKIEERGELVTRRFHFYGEGSIYGNQELYGEGYYGDRYYGNKHQYYGEPEVERWAI